MMFLLERGEQHAFSVYLRLAVFCSPVVLVVVYLQDDRFIIPFCIFMGL
uniref:Uncharacterized protein n=1 Tax=Anguilla anguilla TaxID=7936 RepID=A0A0E9V8X4_ANGAN